jgi:hypothetical protein
MINKRVFVPIGEFLQIARDREDFDATLRTYFLRHLLNPTTTIVVNREELYEEYQNSFGLMCDGCGSGKNVAGQCECGEYLCQDCSEIHIHEAN